MSNPLLDYQHLPPYQHIKPEHVQPAIETILAGNRDALAKILAANKTYTWDTLLQPLEDLQDKINHAWSPVSHLNAVLNSEALREAHNACLPMLSEYGTEMGQNRRLFEAYQAIANSEQFKALNTAQQKVINDALRDFRLSGVDLPEDKKARYKDIQQRLSSLTSKFSDNVLDATQGWKKHITDASQLLGLPDSAMAMAKQTAEAEQQSGWMLTLEFPSYFAVMTYANDRELREEMHNAYVTRASDQGPNAGRWDNSRIMEEILALRHEKAQLLGYNNFAELSLATKMAPDTDAVVGFLKELAIKSKPIAQRDFEELQAFANRELGLADVQPWDLLYVSEKLRQNKYAISQEELKAYFPEPKVVSGLFDIVKRLYGLDICEVRDVETWHKDVRFYEIKDQQGQLRGQFFLDLYARPNKRGGAWMAECQCRRKTETGIQTPVAYLTCNFTPPVGDEPALFTHYEVTTLFHEFGHGLHHLLTQVDYLEVSGINGVAWDAVELPSQFMENWCWEKDALDLIAGHYQTGEPLPEELRKRLLAAKNFQSAMQMVRQLEFALFDFRLHREYDPQLFQEQEGDRIQQVLDEVRQDVAVISPAPNNRFQHSFSHIFAGGYAAGYYSYKWAEVLSADAFSKFEEAGIFDQATGKAFLSNILEQGGSREPLELFIAFRGREPKIDALLRHSGIAA
ncbi:MAG: oligopeptidase A [Gammaproteobacteria bacterium]|jgi:oligopeptidase A